MPEATASRLEAAVRSEAGGVKLIPYLMAGYPDRARSAELGRRYAASGAAAIEIGIPFSDPLADGPTVQRAGQAALEGGMTVAGALTVAELVAKEGVPVVLMTYVNPVFAYEPERFARHAAAAGVAGVIVPDLPAEEAAAARTASCQPRSPPVMYGTSSLRPASRLARSSASILPIVVAVTARAAP